MILFLLCSIIIMAITTTIAEAIEKKFNISTDENDYIEREVELRKLLDKQTINILKNYGLIGK